MLTLPNAVVPILSPFAILFTNPTCQKAQLLLVGTILTPGQPTVAAALRVMGRSDQRDCARYHEVLNRTVGSARGVARVLLVLLLQHLGRGHGPLVFGIDETLGQRRGAKRRRDRYRGACGPDAGTHSGSLGAGSLWRTGTLLGGGTGGRFSGRRGSPPAPGQGLRQGHRNAGQDRHSRRGGLAHFADAVRPEMSPLKDAESQVLNSLATRRHQVMTMLVSAKKRLGCRHRHR